jgi:flagellar M-ring protein FliF
MSEPAASPVPASIRAGWARVAALFGALSRPARVLAVTTLIAAIGVGGWLTARSAYEPYSVLFSQLDRDDAGAIVLKLKEMKVPYRVGTTGDAIEVPEARVHEIRLDLASSGLPRGGGVGFESFDSMKLGATEFEQRVLYRRAMEGELARTIGSIEAIQSARVHLVLPEKSVFAARREAASASVVVKLRFGRVLGASEVAGIVHLVAAAVPSLSPDQIALVSTDGTMLRRPRAAPGKDGAAASTDEDGDSKIHTAEVGLEDRARAMLERVLGPGHVDVRVTAEMDLSRFERTEDHYDPKTSVLRSEESSMERNAGADDDTVAGVPGAESNLPTGAAPGASATPVAGGAIVRESHTRNFEVDHVQEKRTSSGSSIKRLTVAVVVDGVASAGDPHVLVPRERPELDKIAGLVRSAVGANDKRGDMVTVESVLFTDGDVAAPIEAPAPPFAIPAKARKYGPIALGALLGLGLILGVVVTRRRRREAPALTGEAVTPQLTAPQPALQLAEASASTAASTPASLASDREEAIRRATEDPATAALVVRHWLGTAIEERSKAA